MGIWGNNFFSQDVMPGMYANWAAKKYIDPQIKAIEKSEEFDFPEDKSENIIDQLKTEVKDQLDRKKGLEDKIKSILFIISVSITAITFCLKDLNVSKESPLSYLVLVFLGLSILYFVGGAVLALKSLVPIAFHTPQPALEFDDQNKKIVFAITEQTVEIKDLLKSKLANDLINLKVQNKTNAVLVLLRNGLILFAAFFLAALLDKKPKPVENTQILLPIEVKFDTLKRTQIKVGTHDSIVVLKASKEVARPLKNDKLPIPDSVKEPKK